MCLKLLLTGSNGEVGRVLRRHLLQAPGIELYCESSLGYDFDLLNYDSYDLEIGYDALVHLAEPALSRAVSVDESVSAHREFFNRSIKAGVRYIIFLSSYSIFRSDHSGSKFNNPAEIAPRDHYGFSKWHTEQVIKELVETEKVNASVLRLPAILGNKSFRRFLHAMRFLTSIHMSVKCDPRVTKSFVKMETVLVEIMDRLMRYQHQRDRFLGEFEAVTISDGKFRLNDLMALAGGNSAILSLRIETIRGFFFKRQLNSLLGSVNFSTESWLDESYFAEFIERR